MDKTTHHNTHTHRNIIYNKYKLDNNTITNNIKCIKMYKNSIIKQKNEILSIRNVNQRNYKRVRRRIKYIKRRVPKENKK